MFLLILYPLELPWEYRKVEVPEHWQSFFPDKDTPDVNNDNILLQRRDKFSRTITSGHIHDRCVMYRACALQLILCGFLGSIN